METKYAGFWIRVLASLIDMVVLAIPMVFFFLNYISWKSLSVMLLINTIMIVYKPFMEFKYQATLGKMALDIKVKSEDGNPLLLSQILKRVLPWLLTSFMSIFIQIQVMTSPEYVELDGFMQIAQLQDEKTPAVLNGLITLFFFVSVITVAFNARKKGLHDMIAGTVCVVDKEDDGMSD